jgi:hypothetical protein
MGYIQQFAGMLNEIEDEGLKSSLTSAFGNVRLDFDQAIAKRDEAKQSFTTYKQTINNLIGSDNPEDIKGKLEELSKSKNTDVDKLKADLDAKHQADLKTLRDEVDAERSKYSELSSKHESMLFNAEVEKQGLLQGFKTDNPRVKEMLVGEIRDKLILEDGVFYVKDGSTGDKARDIKSGDYLSAKSISESMLQSNEWADFVKPEVKANGGGTPPANNTTTQGKKFSDYTAGELVELRRTNPQQYEALRSTRQI